MVIRAPTTIEKPVYKAEFEYAPPKFGVKGAVKGLSKADIDKKLTGNIVEIGKPECYDLRELCKRKGTKLPETIDMLFEKYDFWLIESPYSFMPAHDSQFEWARIAADMAPLSRVIDYPIAHDAYPRDIYEEKKEKHRVSIGFALKFAEVVEPKAEYIEEIEFTKLEPRITVAGIGKSTPVWEFSDKASFNLKNVNALYTIVKMPTGSQGIIVKFNVYARVFLTMEGMRLPLTSKPLEGEENYQIKFN